MRFLKIIYEENFVIHAFYNVISNFYILYSVKQTCFLFRYFEIKAEKILCKLLQLKESGIRFGCVRWWQIVSCFNIKCLIVCIILKIYIGFIIKQTSKQFWINYGLIIKFSFGVLVSRFFIHKQYIIVSTYTYF